MGATSVSPLEWTLLFNVLFGSIASRAFSEFHQSLTTDFDEDIDVAQKRLTSEDVTKAAADRPGQYGHRYYSLRILVFGAAFFFYVYDWIVVQLLFRRYPYSVTSMFSYFRFANDLLMSFCLFGIVANAARPRVLERPIRIIAFLSVWHLLAAIWHVLADLEYQTRIDFDFPLQWHLVYVQLLYWGTYHLYRRVLYPRQKQRYGVAAAVLMNDLWLLGTESIIVLIISVVRTIIVLYSTSYLH
jgi:hypothetical protein